MSTDIKTLICSLQSEFDRTNLSGVKYAVMCNLLTMLGTAIGKLEAERDHFSKLAANQHSCGPDCRDKAALIAERDELKEFKRAVGKHLNLADDDDGMSLIGRFNQQVGRLEVKAKKWDLIERLLAKGGNVEIWHREHNERVPYLVKFNRHHFKTVDYQPPIDSFDGQNLTELLIKACEASTDGESFQPRGLGRASGPCFVCHKDNAPDINDMASFVEGKRGGEAVEKMFLDAGAKVYLDYRPSEPRWVQIKLCACSEHKPNLIALMNSTGEKGKIEISDIKAVMGVINVQ